MTLGTKLGPYEIVALIGKGGMGVISLMATGISDPSLI